MCWPSSGSFTPAQALGCATASYDCDSVVNPAGDVFDEEGGEEEGGEEEGEDDIMSPFALDCLCDNGMVFVEENAYEEDITCAAIWDLVPHLTHPSHYDCRVPFCRRHAHIPFVGD